VTEFPDRYDVARHHAFEVSVWRDRNITSPWGEGRGWGWSVRLGCATVAQSDEKHLTDSAAEAFSDGTKRLREILKSKASTAVEDFRLVATGLGENPPPSGF
jgi:hypothetical protein